MSISRSLTIQSVLYQNGPTEILRAAEATANSARLAQAQGQLSTWRLSLGDSSPSPSLSEEQLASIREVVEAEGGEFSYEFFGANLGHGGGHNQLAQSDSSELLLFLNPDGLVAPDTVSALMNTVVDNIGVADARQLPIEHPKDFATQSGDASWASGACAMTQRAAYDAIGGFDTETFFMYCDDVDLSWRLKLAGYRVVFEPAARIFHDKRLTTSGDWQPGDAEVYYSAEAALMLAHKYSRTDIAEDILTSFAENGEAPQKRAADEFVRRRDSGLLPAQLDPAHEVGVFVAGNYAIHRY